MCSCWVQPSMVTNDLVSAKGFHPHDFFTGFDVHLGLQGENHHGVVSHVHGVDFLAFDVRHHGRALLDHGHVDAVRDRTDVRDFLVAKNVDEFKASLCGTVLAWLGF